MRRQLVLCFISLLLATPRLLASEPVVRLVTVVDPELPIAQAQKSLLTELFARAKINFTLEYRPSRRAELEFKEGKFDGDAARLSVFSQAYPAAIRVDPPIVNIGYFAISDHLQIKNWADLLPYRIAYLRGGKAIESILASASRLEPVTQFNACVAMVKAKRVDVCIANTGWYRDSELAESRKILKVQHFATMDVYIWLGPTHYDLAKQLGNTLVTMRKDGSLARFQSIIYNASTDSKP